ncbi:MAG: DUF4388 domain-containing protein [Thermoanaerobaculia bacterium]
MLAAVEFSGRLASIPASDLFQWAKNDRRTGALVVRRSSREKRLYFQEGQLVAAFSDNPAEFYGQYLMLNGHVSEADLVRALALAAETGRRLGSVLVELGVLSTETVRTTLRDHIQDVTLDLFLWDRGVFFFEASEPPREAIPAEPLDSLFLAMEGARWVDEYRRVRQLLPHNDVILRRHGAAEVPPGDLAPLELWIWSKVNGKRTLAQLHGAVGGSFFRFLAAALSLCVREVLDIADMQQARQSSTRELSLADLLVDEAQQRDSSGEEETTPVPMATLEKMVPLWIAGRLPSDQRRSFYARCDGTTRLKELLGANRRAELDQLFVAMGRGVLALLPAPLSQLEAAADRQKAPAESRWWRRLLPGGTEGKS